MGVTQEDVDLRDEVFNFVLGTVNTNWGAAVYSSPDQQFQFQKHVRFGDRSNRPDLESNAAGSGVPPSHQLLPYSLTPFHGSSQVPLNQTFDVSGIPPANIGNAQDAATIVAEVSAAAAAQASKEFQCIRSPKLPNCVVDILLMQSLCSGPGEQTFLQTSRTGSWITRLLSNS